MTAELDTLVVGLGHAGVEAALAVARMGGRVMAISQTLSKAGLMSCNPAVGGPGKSQLVSEIDALGGAMARAADETGIQFRVLNRSRGMAAQATRAQVDRLRYADSIGRTLRAQPGLTLLEGDVEGLLASKGRVTGVRLRDGTALRARTTVVTTGTFLEARMHVGDRVEAGGRAGDPPSHGLSDDLRALGLRLGRFKTGTPPRLDGRTIDYDLCAEQPSEPTAGPLSRTTPRSRHPASPQRSCFSTFTSAATHDVVARNLRFSPLLTGAVTARGPRYCPSLEHKVVAYPDRERHAVYLEPEGLDTDLVYPAGLSTSLPAPVQLELLRTIVGLERVELVRPGYAVEYDYVPGDQLDQTLSVRVCSGLFLAGQINGSSGYEEAAAQGLVAGVNAALFAAGRSPWIPGRDQCYLGILCDDLTRGGFDEPYRVLPSRAEARLSLREDNAHLRLRRVADMLGVVSRESTAQSEILEQEIETLRGRLTQAELVRLRRPETELTDLEGLPVAAGVSHEARQQLFLAVRYEPYETQRLTAARRLHESLSWAIPGDLRIESVVGLSGEAVAALRMAKPTTLAEAGQLPGVSTGALAVLAAHLRRRARAG